MYHRRISQQILFHQLASSTSQYNFLFQKPNSNYLIILAHLNTLRSPFNLHFPIQTLLLHIPRFQTPFFISSQKHPSRPRKNKSTHLIQMSSKNPQTISITNIPKPHCSIRRTSHYIIDTSVKFSNCHIRQMSN